MSRVIRQENIDRWASAEYRIDVFLEGAVDEHDRPWTLERLGFGYRSLDGGQVEVALATANHNERAMLTLTGYLLQKGILSKKEALDVLREW